MNPGRPEYFCDLCLLKVVITLLLEEASGQCLSSSLREVHVFRSIESEDIFEKIKLQFLQR